MIGISVQHDIAALRRQFESRGRQIDLAASRALNRAASSARTVAVRDLARSTGIRPQSVIREKLKVRNAYPARLVAEIGAVPYTPNLARFQARQVRAGVSAAAWGKRKIYRGAFLGNSRRTAFRRTSAKRLPIKPLHGPRLHKEFVDRAIVAAMSQVATEAWRKTLRHELQRRIG